MREILNGIDVMITGCYTKTQCPRSTSEGRSKSTFTIILLKSIKDKTPIAAGKTPHLAITVAMCNTAIKLLKKKVVEQMLFNDIRWCVSGATCC